jgi:hypothetical protein
MNSFFRFPNGLANARSAMTSVVKNLIFRAKSTGLKESAVEIYLRRSKSTGLHTCTSMVGSRDGLVLPEN